MKWLLLVALMVLVTLVGTVGFSRAGNEISTLEALAKATNEISTLEALAKATNEVDSTLQAAVNERVMANTKMYYLTENTFDGGDAYMACDPGFHMASMSEIQDISNLQYAYRSTASFESLVDGQRLGAPSNRMGWVQSEVDPPSGTYDCGDWRGKYDTQSSNTIALYDYWYASEHGEPVSGLNTWWQVARKPCSQREPVWCVEDPQ